MCADCAALITFHTTAARIDMAASWESVDILGPLRARIASGTGQNMQRRLASAQSWSYRVYVGRL